jgi:hypothetical protein
LQPAYLRRGLGDAVEAAATAEATTSTTRSLSFSVVLRVKRLASTKRSDGWTGLRDRALGPNRS